MRNGVFGGPGLWPVHAEEGTARAALLVALPLCVADCASSLHFTNNMF